MWICFLKLSLSPQIKIKSTSWQLEGHHFQNKKYVAVSRLFPLTFSNIGSSKVGKPGTFWNWLQQGNSGSTLALAPGDIHIFHNFLRFCYIISSDWKIILHKFLYAWRCWQTVVALFWQYWPSYLWGKWKPMVANTENTGKPVVAIKHLYDSIGPHIFEVKERL